MDAEAKAMLQKGMRKVLKETDFFGEPSIFSMKEQKNAISAYAHGCDQKDILAMCDDSVFQNGKKGWVVTYNTVYTSKSLKVISGNKGAANGKIDITDAKKITRSARDMTVLNIEYRDGKTLTVDCGLDANDLYKIIEQILRVKAHEAVQKTAKAKKAESTKEPPAEQPKTTTRRKEASVPDESAVKAPAKVTAAPENPEPEKRARKRKKAEPASPEEDTIKTPVEESEDPKKPVRETNQNPVFIMARYLKAGMCFEKDDKAYKVLYAVPMYSDSETHKGYVSVAYVDMETGKKVVASFLPTVKFRMLETEELEMFLLAVTDKEYTFLEIHPQSSEKRRKIIIDVDRMKQINSYLQFKEKENYFISLYKGVPYAVSRLSLKEEWIETSKLELEMAVEAMKAHAAGTIEADNLKKGMVIEVNDELNTVLKVQRIRTGYNSYFFVKWKDILTGEVHLEQCNYSTRMKRFETEEIPTRLSSFDGENYVFVESGEISGTAKTISVNKDRMEQIMENPELSFDTFKTYKVSLCGGIPYYISSADHEKTGIEPFSELIFPPELKWEMVIELQGEAYIVRRITASKRTERSGPYTICAACENLQTGETLNKEFVFSEKLKRIKTKDVLMILSNVSYGTYVFTPSSISSVSDYGEIKISEERMNQIKDWINMPLEIWSQYKVSFCNDIPYFISKVKSEDEESKPVKETPKEKEHKPEKKPWSSKFSEVIMITDVEPGMVIDVNNELSAVLEIQPVNPDEKDSFIRIKYENIETGDVRVNQFKHDYLFLKHETEKIDMILMLFDGEDYLFDSFDDIDLEEIENTAVLEIPAYRMKQIAKGLKLPLYESAIYTIYFCHGIPFKVTLME